MRILAAASLLLFYATSGLAAPPPRFAPGAAGIGDPYFPNAGNGGYDVEHYKLEVRYDPATDELIGRATITAAATQDLSRFNLDLEALTVDGISVNGRGATWSRDAAELSITPSAGLRRGAAFETIVRYHGVPLTKDSVFGSMGFMHTADGALVVGEPEVAATWFPANDHPRDPARFTLEITAPADLEVVANGHLISQRTKNGWTTWLWQAGDPMAPYLVGWTIGKYAVDRYEEGGRSVMNAIDVDLFTPAFEPTSGERMVLSGAADLSYKRMTREIAIPDEGAALSFFVNRHTEESWDFFFVEARPAGTEEWTTLPDRDGHASQDVGSCALWWFHPQMQSYQTDCAPTGLTGDWWAATGASDGWEEWVIDLSRYAGQTVEVSLAYASDDVVQMEGVAIDDVVFSTGERTSFEDGDTGGWRIPGDPPAGSFNDNDWRVGTALDGPPPLGAFAHETLARQGEFLSFLEGVAGDYPFRDVGGIVHDHEGVGFALENQTRPIYPADAFMFGGAESLVVHELAHQWFGDRVLVDSWQHTWLNEGFATYMEWLWSEHQGSFSAQDYFDWNYSRWSGSLFWRLTIGDPGAEHIFDGRVYLRGAMTLHALRTTIGDAAFFAVLKEWTARGGHGTSAGLMALAEEISGMELGGLFDAWLFQASKPEL